MPKKSTPPAPSQPQEFYVYAFDLSQRRPGFAEQHVKQPESGTFSVCGVRFTNVDNKTASKTHGEILEEIHEAAQSFTDRSSPSYFVRERAYIARSALNESGKFEVVGIMTLLAHRKGKVFDEISPKTVKKMIGGDGRATKQQVADGLTHYVGLLPFACDDESDAVALGLTWLMQHGTLQPLDPSL